MSHRETPKGKGRPKKTGFKGIPKKLKFDEAHLVADDCNLKSKDKAHDAIENILPSNSQPAEIPIDISETDSNQILSDTNKLYGNQNWCKKISVVRSDILNVRCDAIVNAAKMNLLGGGNIDGKIHRKAGIQFSLKCRALPIKGKDSNGNDIRCHTGECEVTDC